MKFLCSSKIRLVLVGFVVALLVGKGLQPGISYGLDGVPPIADAGLSRYAGQNAVVLDGTGSYDPDNSGPLSYQWSQATGPSVVITNANTATPTISGFTQTSDIQECEFELVVSDGVLTSLPDTIKVIIVPGFGATRLIQENPPFNPDKPTVIYFGGGNCQTGGGSWDSTAWNEKANIISFPSYGPDPGGGSRTYYRCGDMIIVYLSSVAPDYKQPIQAIGFSTGGDPAIDVGIYLNQVYRDARYAVNRVTFLDAGCPDPDYDSLVQQFSASSVDGEQSWVDAYQTGITWATFFLNALNVLCPSMSHGGPPNWYQDSLTNADMNKFNNGVIGGAYWSVIGHGKNLQLASTPGTMTYVFEWHGTRTSGYMDFYDEPTYPGRLPEPITLVEPNYVNEAGGYILACEESQNAIGYELLSGSEPHRVMDYNVISDTPAPPNEVITTLPFEDTWWTVRVRDQYGSTIYADPEYINLDTVDFDRNGKVDFKDFSILAQYWHQNESSVDIGPPPYGDGIIDFKDVGVLAGRWLTVAKIPPGQASNPNPADGATGIGIDADLSWTPGDVAALHEVYFGSDPCALPLVATQPAGQDSYDPGDPNLMLSTTYYWRIDGISDAGPPPGKWPGVLWSFTTVRGQAHTPSPADGSVIPGIKIEYPPDSGNWYIYTELDVVPGPTADPDPNVRRAYFSKNRDDVVNRIQDANLGPPPYMDPCCYQPDPDSYFVGLPASAYEMDPYAIVPETGLESLERGEVYYWCVDETDADGHTFGGDIWEFTIQGFYAFAPSPPNDAILVDPNVVLSWSEGYGASKHDVYLGTSWDDVNNAYFDFVSPSPEHQGTTNMGVLSWQCSGLPTDTKIYWRIDEVQGRMLPLFPGIIYKGDVWSFTTGVPSPP